MEVIIWRKSFLATFLSLILFFCPAFSSYAEEPAETEAQTEDKTEDKKEKTLGDFLMEFAKGSVEYKFFGQFHKVRQDRKQYLHELILNLDLKHEFREGSGKSIVLKPVFRADNRHFTQGVIDTAKETDERRYYVNFKEAYLALRGEKTDFYLGKKVYSWGKAEGFNPTDDINPYDFMDFLEREKIGVFSTSVEYAIGDSSVDVVFIPHFTPARLPGQNNRWSGNVEDQVTVSSTTTLPQLPQLEVRGRELPPNTPRNSQAGGRLKTTVSGWDFALSIYHGIDSIPVAEEEVIGITTYYTPRFNQVNEFGFATATTFDKLEVHAEASHRDTLHGNDDDFIAYIAGGSYSWDEFGLEFIEKVSLYFEYAGEEVTLGKRNPKRHSSSSYGRPFKNSVLGSLVFKFSEDADFQLGGSYNIDDYDYYLQPKATYKLSDRLKLKAGVDILRGDRETFWGKWRKNDRIFTHLIWHF